MEDDRLELHMVFHNNMQKVHWDTDELVKMIDYEMVDLEYCKDYTQQHPSMTQEKKRMKNQLF